ncbi:hypothetical protein QBC47DRAFT_382339 [Echria macrotheca]|uniref:Uncharacterized protein n=1 Tax=Echria macrotheca TaxID=438768 RepID=A0AAJ0BBW1_9PEZI|nr:hypothetical protein QBC47DRAFT_382339 [Echria macrotheca]
MSNNGSEAAKETPPQRARHQITRSISELSSPIRLHRHQSHRAAKDKDGLGAVPQTIPPPQGRLSLDGSRSDGVTPNLSPNPSRRASILNTSGDDAPSGAAPSVSAPVPMPKAAVREDMVAIERQRAMLRESGLKKSLAELADFSVATTRRLDDTYFSVRDKLDVLQSTIVALKELAGLSQQMNRAFNIDAEELDADISAQLDAFGQFEDQQKRIEKLQERIHIGRDKIRVLSKRVDVVRERIENWERADREWQERTRRRLKAVWVVTSVILFLMLILYLAAQYAAQPLEETTVRLANDTLKALRNVTGAKTLWPESTQPTTTIEGILGRTGSAATSSSSTDVLRVFDEL